MAAALVRAFMSGTGAQQGLSPAEIAQYEEAGFLPLPALTTPAEAAHLREVFSRLFQERVGWERGAQFDLAGTDEDARPMGLPQLLHPLHFVPELAHTEYHARALAIARQLLGPGAALWFDHAILKPAHHGRATPWHQDEAHRLADGTRYQQISIWMPLQEATEANGCMRYLPGTHRGPLLEHRSPGNDPRVMALECVGEFSAQAAVACPLLPGGAVLHHWRTLHAAGPNATGEPRLAYILAFRSPLEPDPEFQDYPWIQRQHTAAQARAAAWGNRGGWLGRTARHGAAFSRRGFQWLRRRVRHGAGRG